MITLRGKLKKNSDVLSNKSDEIPGKRISIRDKLLIKEAQEMEQNLPSNCKVTFNDPHCLHEFDLLIVPDEGYWSGGYFHFLITVPEDYNIIPPTVKCLTKLWHPNINEDGQVCLSILRQSSIDGMGWAPTRKLKDIVWGLCSLFSDLLNFDDPLNKEAADMFSKDKELFYIKVKEYILQYAKR
ncbi:NEDD8-conjugating enzyme UBE2F-like [Phymastichus coffea]|uniref:NEDD8-conjugating enzyme UBE2F-like n=1 Tax=Phymastichus coffea TaxID=108790 RepID=UPI00273BF756|nr:NEDD8-conjugating enzyme UBE2F-like [Phymastichus coffea]XP_058807925.1 NEDD8-conjugating enzyme UBE2F-like [Phymastichus coffea]XP_058807926.1 NEDD8-conjugating enzyme UBE2F-like [Phymastichus coffea]XP_058807927.1 NEDD8-conjugating enzyme UBE2F-like [Phymastichus coffea]